MTLMATVYATSSRSRVAKMRKHATTMLTLPTAMTHVNTLRMVTTVTVTAWRMPMATVYATSSKWQVAPTTRRATSTVLPLMMTTHVNSNRALDVPMQKLVTTTQRPPSMMAAALNRMSVEFAVEAVFSAACATATATSSMNVEFAVATASRKGRATAMVTSQWTVTIVTAFA